jgi:D-alanyl-D-alanine carboxypeptidase
LRCALALPWLLAGCGGGGNAAPTDNTIPPTTGTLTERLTAYLANLPSSQPGISVMLMRDGTEFFAGAQGLGNSHTLKTVGRFTGFRLASVSKPFTAIAVMQLVERGQLRLSDSLLDYIPELPGNWRAITLEHLLTHRSGVIDIFNDFWTPVVFAGMTLDGLMPYLATRQPKLEFEPGSRGDYSNTGYMLLAKVIERRTGARFGDHMAENIFKPAGMVDSFINDEFRPLRPGDALNYADRTTFYGHTNYLKGSMAQVSSADDFLHFFQALLTNKLVSAATLASMMTSHSNLVSGGSCGYAFFMTSYGVTHLGEWDSFYTLMGIDMARRRAWAVLTNSGATGRAQVVALDRMISESL